VVFRGTDDLAGWIIDAEFDQIQLPFAPSGVAVHQGFSNDFNGSISAVAVLLQAAQAACASCSNLIVSGHSLGGGLALLSAAYLATQNKMGFATMRLQTYGAPRVGNPAFASWYATLNVPTQRMTWHRDCVPRLPWRNTLFLWKYHHVAYELFFNGTGYHMCDSSGEDANCIDRYLIENPLDHALYMNHDLLDGIVHGCLYTDPMVSMGVQALVDLVDDDAN
jgi:predicted lipase